MSQYVNKDNKIGAIIEFIEIMLVLKETKIFIFSANFNLISTKTTKFYLEIKFFLKYDFNALSSQCLQPFHGTVLATRFSRTGKLLWLELSKKGLEIVLE